MTACASSLVAVHMASLAIRAGDCDMVMAGADVALVGLLRSSARLA